MIEHGYHVAYGWQLDEETCNKMMEIVPEHHIGELLFYADRWCSAGPMLAIIIDTLDDGEVYDLEKLFEFMEHPSQDVINFRDEYTAHMDSEPKLFLIHEVY